MNLILATLISLQSVAVFAEIQDVAVGGGEAHQDKSQKINKIKYMFDQDAAAAQCEKTQRENDDETFRLFCINRKQSFKLCSLSCSNALHFEGSVGKCEPHRCSFFGQNFEKSDGKSLQMSKVAQGKVTLFGIVPLWEAQAQYFYELAEYVKSLEPDTVEGVIMPLYVEDKEPVEFTPLGQGEDDDSGDVPEVTILKTVKPEELSTHPMLMFLQSLTPESGFPTFDFYFDRPVFFAISHDGNIVERMVAPTKDTLMVAVEKYSKGYKPSSSRKTTAEM